MIMRTSLIATGATAGATSRGSVASRTLIASVALGRVRRRLVDRLHGRLGRIRVLLVIACTRMEETTRVSRRESHALTQPWNEIRHGIKSVAGRRAYRGGHRYSAGQREYARVSMDYLYRSTTRASHVPVPRADGCDGGLGHCLMLRKCPSIGPQPLAHACGGVEDACARGAMRKASGDIRRRRCVEGDDGRAQRLSASRWVGRQVGRKPARADSRRGIEAVEGDRSKHTKHRKQKRLTFDSTAAILTPGQFAFRERRAEVCDTQWQVYGGWTTRLAGHVRERDSVHKAGG